MNNILSTTICGVNFKNPVILASGTCGFGRELYDLYDLEKIGGISSKGLTLNPRDGNDGIRIYETPSGIMNSVGLENPGVKAFIDADLNWINSLDIVNIVNLGGHCIEDYIEGVELLNDCELDFIELNISCPNVKQGGMNFGVKTGLARDVVKQIRKVCKHRLMVKLSPNAEDITELAKACAEQGADAISLVNTFLAMAIDINSRKPVFENTYAGLSGPAIKPVALRMVHQVAKAVPVPVIGMGGITTAADVVEFIMAGASAVQIGTASFMNPLIPLKIIEDLADYFQSQKISCLEEIRGIV